MVANEFSLHLGLVERHRRLVDQVPNDPLAPHRWLLEKAEPGDRTARHLDIPAKVTGASRMAAISSAPQPASPDPFARQRRIVVQTVPSA